MTESSVTAYRVGPMCDSHEGHPLELSQLSHPCSHTLLVVCVSVTSDSCDSDRGVGEPVTNPCHSYSE